MYFSEHDLLVRDQKNNQLRVGWNVYSFSIDILEEPRLRSVCIVACMQVTLQTSQSFSFGGFHNPHPSAGTNKHLPWNISC